MNPTSSTSSTSYTDALNKGSSVSIGPKSKLKEIIKAAPSRGADSSLRFMIRMEDRARIAGLKTSHVILTRIGTLASFIANKIEPKVQDAGGSNTSNGTADQSNGYAKKSKRQQLAKTLKQSSVDADKKVKELKAKKYDAGETRIKHVIRDAQFWLKEADSLFTVLSENNLNNSQKRFLTDLQRESEKIDERLKSADTEIKSKMKGPNENTPEGINKAKQVYKDYISGTGTGSVEKLGLTEFTQLKSELSKAKQLRDDVTSLAKIVINHTEVDSSDNGSDDGSDDSSSRKNFSTHSNSNSTATSKNSDSSEIHKTKNWLKFALRLLDRANITRLKTQQVTQQRLSQMTSAISEFCKPKLENTPNSTSTYPDLIFLREKISTLFGSASNKAADSATSLQNKKYAAVKNRINNVKSHADSWLNQASNLLKSLESKKSDLTNEQTKFLNNLQKELGTTKKRLESTYNNIGLDSSDTAISDKTVYKNYVSGTESVKNAGLTEFTQLKSELSKAKQLRTDALNLTNIVNKHTHSNSVESIELSTSK